MAKMPTPDELLAATPAFPARNWMDTKPDFRAGTFCYPAKPETMAGMGFANALYEQYKVLSDNSSSESDVDAVLIKPDHPQDTLEFYYPGWLCSG